MSSRHALAGLAVLAVLALWTTANTAAAEKTHEGSVVSVAAGKMVMVDKEGKNEHSHMVADLAKVTLNGKAAKLIDLKKGDKVKVTTESEGKVIAVAATRDS